MKVLLDTQVLIWAFTQPSRLRRATADLLVDPDTAPVFSLVSIWEIAVKRPLDKPDFRVEPDLIHDTAIGRDFTQLGISVEHALRVRRLPLYHSDPFDRLLVSQAMHESMPLVTSDRALSRYDIETIRA